MGKIVILSASVRTGRASHRVALFFEKFIREHKFGDPEILDLAKYNFPVFEERLKYQKQPSAEILEFAGRIKTADAVLIVTPEYNGGYPSALKNVTDLLYEEWYRKPIAIATVSDGVFGGTQVITSLLFTLWKMKAWVVPSMFPVPKVRENYSETGDPTDKESIEKRAKGFLNDLSWCIVAKNKMQV